MTSQSIKEEGEKKGGEGFGPDIIKLPRLLWMVGPLVALVILYVSGQKPRN